MVVKDISAVVGTYENAQGEKKERWATIGALFIKDDGKMSIKLDTIPVGWNGNAGVFDRKAREQQPQQQTHAYGGRAPEPTQVDPPF